VRSCISIGFSNGARRLPTTRFSRTVSESIHYSWSSGTGPYCQTGPNNVTCCPQSAKDKRPKRGASDISWLFQAFHGHCATNSVVNVNPPSGTIFVNWQLDGSGDYHLKPGSPAIDAGEHMGSNSFVAPTTDFFGGNQPIWCED
jgi:hypothetical protein